MIDPGTLYVIIKMHRKAAKLSQLQLAEMAGVGKTVVYDIEKGKETIQLATLRKILNVLNIKIELVSPYMNQVKVDNNEKR
jgi:y4mF family transcriptional regulator